MKTTVSLYVIGIDPVVRWKTTSIADMFKGKDSFFARKEDIFLKHSSLTFSPSSPTACFLHDYIQFLPEKNVEIVSGLNKVFTIDNLIF